MDENVTLSRAEKILKACINKDGSLCEPPQSRVEKLLLELYNTISNLDPSSGGIGKDGDGENSTIFNDYENNKALTQYSTASGCKTIAGKKAFKITAMPSTTSFTLDSVEGLTVGDIVSYSYAFSGSGTTSIGWKEGQDLAKITAISGTTITLDSEIQGLTATDIANYQSSSNRIACRLWVNAKPTIGTYDLSTKANARGRENEALGEASDVSGKGNIVTAPYGTATNASNKVDAESGFAFGTDNILEQTAVQSVVGGNGNKNRAFVSFLGGAKSESQPAAEYSFGWGRGLKVQNPDEAVFGEYNAPKNNLLFSIGNGDNDNARNNAVEVYKDGSINFGDINRVAYVNTEGVSGWIKFAEYSFAKYKGGAALINIKQAYVGTKYNALIELEINTVDNGFHSSEGFVFRQIAGFDITNKVCYSVDATTHNVSFYIKKTIYDYIYINLLSDTFGGYMQYYSNEAVSEPNITGYLSGSVLGATKGYVDTKFGSIDLSDYYNKSEIDSKISRVYKYKYSLDTALLLPPASDNTVGDVYNIICGAVPVPIYRTNSSCTLASLTSITYGYRLTLSNVSDSLNMVAGNYIALIVEMPENFGGGTMSVVGVIKSYSNSVLEVEMVTSEDPAMSQTACFDSNWGILQAAMSMENSLTIQRRVIATPSGDKINSGTNVAWNGSYWDTLGTTIDLSNVVTKDEVQSMIDSAIAAHTASQSGGTD